MVSVYMSDGRSIDSESYERLPVHRCQMLILKLVRMISEARIGCMQQLRGERRIIRHYEYRERRVSPVKPGV